jgi:hypothetical protein
MSETNTMCETVMATRAELEPQKLQQELDERGSHGWELVSVDQGVYIFKRVKQPRRTALGNL